MSKINPNLKPVDCQKCNEIGLSSNPYNLCDNCLPDFDQDFNDTVMMESINQNKQIKINMVNNQNMKKLDNNETLVISAFPGVGKSEFYNMNANSHLMVIDSISDEFSWDNSNKTKHSDWPNNYVTHIKTLIGHADVIMISINKDVRLALNEAGIYTHLIYPDNCLYDEYMARYVKRGSHDGFIKMMSQNFMLFVNEIEAEQAAGTLDKFHYHKIQKEKQYLSEIIYTL